MPVGKDSHSHQPKVDLFKVCLLWFSVGVFGGLFGVGGFACWLKISSNVAVEDLNMHVNI